MLTKLVASALVVGGTASIGFLTAGALRRRPVELRALQTALQILATEVGYGATPLPRALARVSHAVGGPAGRLCAVAAEELRSGGGGGAHEAWLRALESVFPESAWRRSDLEVLAALAPCLGASHREDQLRHLRLCQERLAAAEEEAWREARERARLAEYLGVLGGLLLVLLAV